MTINTSGNGRRRRRSGIQTKTILILLGLGMIGLLVEPLLAPPTKSRQIYGIGSPSVRQNDLDLMRDTLHLDEFQQEIVSTFYDVYREDFNTAHNEYRDRKREVIDQMKGLSGDAMERLSARHVELDNEWKRQSEDLEKQFFAEVQSLLTTDQRSRWSIFERERRRQHLIGQGTSRYDGEHVDLIALADELNMPEAQRESIDALLEQYASTLDPKLRQREVANEALIEQQERRQRSGNEGQDLERFERNLHDAHIAICRTNEQFSDRIISTLATPWNDRFREAWRQRAFRSIFNPTRASRYLDRIRALENLTEAQVARIEQIEADHERQLEPLNLELMEVRRAQRDQFQPSFFNAPRGPGPDGGFTNLGPLQREPVYSSSGRTHTDLWKARNDLDYEIMNRLHDLLTEEQRQRVPKPFGGRSGGPNQENSRKRLERKSGDR